MALEFNSFHFLMQKCTNEGKKKKKSPNTNGFLRMERVVKRRRRKKNFDMKRGKRIEKGNVCGFFE